MGVSKQTILQYSDFYNWLVLERQVKKSTALNRLSYHKHFLDWLGTREFNFETLTAFMAEKREKCTATYINHFREYARVYTYYLKARGQSFDSKILEIKKLKELAPLKTTMSDEEIESFLKLPPPRNGQIEKRAYNRWTMFYKIMCFTGMRPNEVATLTIDTVDFGRSVFIINPENSKTNNLRYVPIPPNILEELSKYIKSLETKELFISKYGNTYNSVDWGYNFHKRLKRLGIKRKGLTPYSLRHSYITRMIEEDVNIFKVQKLVGHSRIDTTAKYTHLTTKDMQKTILKHPMVRKGADKKIMVENLMEYVKSLDCSVLRFNYSRNILTLKIKFL